MGITLSTSLNLLAILSNIPNILSILSDILNTLLHFPSKEFKAPLDLCTTLLPLFKAPFNFF